jgi:hypothetical protein
VVYKTQQQPIPESCETVMDYIEVFMHSSDDTDEKLYKKLQLGSDTLEFWELCKRDLEASNQGWHIEPADGQHLGSP